MRPKIKGSNRFDDYMTKYLSFLKDQNFRTNDFLVKIICYRQRQQENTRLVNFNRSFLYIKIPVTYKGNRTLCINMEYVVL